MRKKGVELSMNVIIIAAIGLLILLILAYLVVNGISPFPKAKQECTLQQGLCQTQQCALGQQILTGTCPTGEWCCKAVG